MNMDANKGRWQLDGRTCGNQSLYTDISMDAIIAAMFTNLGVNLILLWHAQLDAYISHSRSESA